MQRDNRDKVFLWKDYLIIHKEYIRVGCIQSKCQSKRLKEI